MKSLITLSIIFCCFTSAGYSQSATTQSTPKGDSTKNKKWVEKGRFIIAGEIGVGWNGNVSWSAGNDQLFVTSSPEYGGCMAYILGKGFSVGVALAYETGTRGLLEPYEIWDYVSRVNIGVFCCKHLNRDHTYFDNYIGIKGSMSYWKDNYVGPPFPNPWVIGAPHLTIPSIQAFYGHTLYPGGGPVGFNVEVGIGVPYFVQAGLLFRM